MAPCRASGCGQLWLCRPTDRRQPGPIELLAADEGADLIQIASAAHALESLSLSIGATRVSQLCAALEFGCNQGTCTDPAAAAKHVALALEITLDILPRVAITEPMRHSA